MAKIESQKTNLYPAKKTSSNGSDIGNNGDQAATYKVMGQ